MPYIFGKPDSDLLRDETLVEIFESTASRHANRSAISTEGMAITYAELSRRVTRLSELLVARGIGRGARVALFVPRSIEACAAILAVLKVGAAYVPIDLIYPDQRCTFIVEDCNAALVLTTQALLARATKWGVATLAVDDEGISSETVPPVATGAMPRALPDDVAYIIYTSGTTGRPKGVPMTHRSVCHFVRAEAKIFDVRPDDRVYHGFSLAFDASVEELWLAWFAGATLVIAESEIATSGADLAIWMDKQKVTVLSCVPTLLTLFDDEIPSLRLLILGGEVCPPALVERWSTPVRRVVNTYGPTEACVVATYAFCEPGKPVTIGQPLPNYVACVLDEHLKQVESSEAGELCLGGPGIASGYLNRPELTEQKFITNNDKNTSGAPSRLYRTGDRVRINSQGDLEFLGRVDDQVKLRGYRVELGEIETALRALPGVRQAAVVLHEEASGIAQLAGYLVLDADATFDEPGMRSLLRKQLPAFMVPAHLETIASLPTLASGKIDRAALPAPSRVIASSVEPQEEGQTEIECRVLKVWRDLFAPQSVGRSDNFFDLGGHSLLAARMISELRRDPLLQKASIVDVYRHPKASEFAQALEEESKTKSPVPPAPEPPQVSKFGRWCCWFGQMLSLYIVFAVYSLQWFVPWFVFDWFEDTPHRALYAGLLALAIAFVFQPIQMLVCVAVKWIVIGRFREGDYPLWGFYYWRFWLVRSVYKLFSFSNLHGTPFMPLFCRLMGASVGSNVYLGSEFEGGDLIEIGEGTCLNAAAQVRFFRIEDGLLKLRRIRLGKNCEIGQFSIVEAGAVMEDNSRLGPLSLLSEGVVVPAGETWEGSPAKRVGKNEQLTPPPTIHTNQKLIASCFYILGFLALAIFPLVAMVPGNLFLAWVETNFGWWWTAAGVPVLILSAMLLFALQVAAVKWLLLGRVVPGRYPLHGYMFIKHWFCDRLLHLSLDVLFPAYATLYLPPWLRLLGARIGRGVEVSTMMHFTPDLIDFGDNVFIADATSIGAPRVRNGWFELQPVKIGANSFIGNGSVVAGGTELGEKCLIGCLSLPPTSARQRMLYDGSWMGSPAVFLPRRAVSTQFTEEVTYRPTRQLYILRLLIELVRLVLPGTVVVIVMTLLMFWVTQVGYELEYHEVMAIFPFFTMLLGLLMAAFVIAMKWLLIGRYEEQEQPLWSTFVWRTELVTALHEYIAVPMFLNALKGTPFLSWYLRALGARVGSDVYLDSTYMTEFDLVEIGSRCCIDSDCDLQTHLFEDRVMKTSYVRLGDRCSVGALSVVLYDTQVGDGVSLAPLSLVLKGETLPSGGRWIGSPVQSEFLGSPGGEKVAADDRCM